MKIYVASSWRNPYQQEVVAKIRLAGNEVYDFRNPAPGNTGFHWSEIDPEWQNWTPEKYRSALDHDIARDGFKSDWNAMKWAEGCALIMPCGRSAHIEAGYFVGAGKPLYILILDACEPDLMYRMATSVCLSIEELISAIEQEVPLFCAPPDIDPTDELHNLS